MEKKESELRAERLREQHDTQQSEAEKRRQEVRASSK
jgi:hypothetical protein